MKSNNKKLAGLYLANAAVQDENAKQLKEMSEKILCISENMEKAFIPIGVLILFFKNEKIFYKGHHTT